jgi:hypothetical protein
LEYHYNYILSRLEYCEFSSDKSPFRIKYSRYTDYETYHKDSIPSVKGKEFLGIKFYHYRYYGYNLEFQVVFDSATVVPFQHYQDTLVLGNKSFLKVYSAFVDTTTIDQGFIQPIGIYFNKEKGFIGYFLNNGEKWVID